jgi:hypothetical protein
MQPSNQASRQEAQGAVLGPIALEQQQQQYVGKGGQCPCKETRMLGARRWALRKQAGAKRHPWESLLCNRMVLPSASLVLKWPLCMQCRNPKHGREVTKRRRRHAARSKCLETGTMPNVFGSRYVPVLLTLPSEGSHAQTPHMTSYSPGPNAQETHYYPAQSHTWPMLASALG